ncbi:MULTISPECIES: hypothetical protein [Micrococcus]|uniref:Uncharacterized protein n=1 Tax=Micrococcus aloeverae TaxID=1391911 RepID=A0ABR6DVG4_9MICC|nr:MULTISPECIES: hypothetical protein [Micrococcus]MBA9080260.1 hypothetical protein [Micrococcus aloeverae]MEB2538361.1 hypothetical protein [Micrococcus luteus]
MDKQLQQSLTRIASAHRAITEELEALLRNASADDFSAIHDEAHTPKEWDPELDHPLMTPKVVSSVRAEQDWCCLTYIGGIYAINKREGRGATASEVRHYAQKAGYKDGRAVTAWSKGNGATQNDPDKHRWVTQTGVDHWVKQLASKLGVSLPEDLAEPWQAPDFRTAKERRDRGSRSQALKP